MGLLVCVMLCALASSARQAQAPVTAAAPKVAAAAYAVAWTQPIVLEGAGFILPTTKAIVVAGGNTSISGRAPDDGRELWSVALHSNTRPAATESLLGAVLDGRLVAIDLQNGRQRWQVDLPPGSVSVHAGGKFLLTDAAGQLSAWTAEGTKAWQADVGASVIEIVAAADLLVSTTAPALVAVDLATGSVRWRIGLPVEARELAAGGGHLYFGGDDGVLYSYRWMGHASRAWRFPMIATIGRAAIDDRLAYFTLIDNSLRALDRKGGTQRWSRTLPSRPAAGPVRTATHVVVVLTIGDLLAFPTRPGSEGPGAPSSVRVLATEKAQVEAVAGMEGAIYTLSVTESGARVLSVLRPRPAEK
jgi:outer membrane protein assembly factor BamB